MKSLILFSIFVAAVKAGKVNYDQGTLIENDKSHQGKVTGPHSQKGCENISYITSKVTVTSTMLWLNTATVPVSSLVLNSTSYTVFVTTTEYATITGTQYETPCTFTALPEIKSKWVTRTETETEVVVKTYINVAAVTETTSIGAEAIEVSVECHTRTVDGKTNYITRTTYWTHTQTMHDKVMVGTEVADTVTSTYHISVYEAEQYTEYVTKTETATKTYFDTTSHSTASTLWVTHAVKTVCNTPKW